MLTEYVAEIYCNATAVSMSSMSSGILYFRSSNERNSYVSLLLANVSRSNEKC